jgi:hypothetical protein
MSEALHAYEALEFVREQGVVLASARGAVPRLIEAILGEPIIGSWWGHPEGRFIFNVMTEVTESEEVLVCRLLHGKVTLVHKRLWPALVRVADRFTPEQLAQVCERHMPTGRHVTTEIAFPKWVPEEVQRQASLLGETEAVNALGPGVFAKRNVSKVAATPSCGK